MEKDKKPQVVAIICIILGIVLIVFIIFKIYNFYHEKKQIKDEIVTYKKEDISAMVNGEAVQYISLGEEYIDEGITAYYKSKNISNNYSKAYFKEGNQVSKIDTDSLGSYLIRYTISYKGKSRVISRAVIIIDDKSPSLSIPKDETITSAQASTYDLSKGVVVSDNSGSVNLKFKNTLSTVPGSYIIVYKASDNYGNTTIKKRLIKVTSGILFDYSNGEVVISFPTDNNYTYKYSLDGGNTFVECSNKVTIILEDTVIASVYENNKFVMANSYTKN